jgi:isocitrate lyase
MDFPDLELTGAIHDAPCAVYPRWLFCFGYTNSYDWARAGFAEANVKVFPFKMVKQDAVFQASSMSLVCQTLQRSELIH